MLTAAQDIDNFIERQRSKTNKQSNRQQANHQQRVPPPPPPPPTPPPPSLPPNHSNDQSEVRQSQVFDGASTHLQAQQSHHPYPVAPFADSSLMDQQHEQNFANDDTTKSYFAFFDRFGTHDQVRARLNNDLKREYNEYLRSLQDMAKNKTSQMTTPRGNTTRRVQFQQEHMTVGPQEQHDRSTMQNGHSMNGSSSSSKTVRRTQSMNDGSSGRAMHNMQSMNDLSSTTTSELAANRSHARLLQQHSEQYIRDREEYILELYEQIHELEGRIRLLETDSRKLTVTNSTSATRARYTEDLNALNALLAERLNQRVAVDHELAQILNRPPVPFSGGRIVVNGATNITVPTGQITQRPIDNLQLGRLTPRNVEKPSIQTRKAPEPQQFQSPRTNPGRPASPSFARGSIYNGIFGSYKTEEQVIRQERYRQDLLQQIEEKRQRDAAELARRRAEEERERAKQLAHQQQLDRQLAEEALRKEERDEQERRRLRLLEEELERQQREEELQRIRKEEEAERQRRLEEIARQRREDDAERQKKREELERQRQEEEAERQKRREEEERLRKLQELERQRRKENENERRKREEEERHRRKLEEEEEQRRRQAEEERRRRQEEEEEEERRKRKKEDEAEEERRRREEEERRRREEEWRLSLKVVRSNSSMSLPREDTESDVLLRLQQLKRQLKDKENRLRDTIKTDSTTTVTHRTHVVDYSSPPYLPPPQPFYLQRRESSDDLLDVARIHYRDAPLTHDILLNILKTADGDELNPSYMREDSVIMRGIGEGKRITSAEFLTLPKRPDIASDLFSTSLQSLTGRRQYGTSLPAFYDSDYPVDMADKEINRITVKNDHRLSKLRHIELDDGEGFDAENVLERFEEKQRSQRRGSQVTIHDDAWLK